MPSRGSSSSCLVCAAVALLMLASSAAAFSLSAGGDGNDRAEQLMASRRRCLTTIVAPAVLGWGITPPASQSAEGNERLLLGGVATLKDGTRFAPPEGLSSAALYVTARPETMSNLQQYSVQGGKAPPVLAARFPISGEDAFPFRFRLTANDVTQEGAFGLDSADSTKPYWWENETLVVSARLDTDGIAATRNPEDLVGRGVGKALSGDDVIVQLEGRGLFGKAVTNKNK